MQVYLAGGKGDWRTPLIQRWSQRGVKCYDPFTHSRQDAVYQFTNDDLAAIAESGLIFGNCNYHRYTGMALEFGYAHALGIPIIFVLGQDRIDPMMSAVAVATFIDFDAAVEFTEERYL